MTAAEERILVWVTKTEKAQIVKRAKVAGLSTGEYMRRAAASFRPSEDDEAMEAMIDQMLRATERAGRAIDDTLKFVAESNRRIAAMEADNKSPDGCHGQDVGRNNQGDSYG